MRVIGRFRNDFKDLSCSFCEKIQNFAVYDMSFATWSFTGENINNNNEAVKFKAEEKLKLGGFLSWIDWTNWLEQICSVFNWTQTTTCHRILRNDCVWLWWLINGPAILHLIFKGKKVLEYFSEMTWYGNLSPRLRTREIDVSNLRFVGFSRPMSYDDSPLKLLTVIVINLYMNAIHKIIAVDYQRYKS